MKYRPEIDGLRAIAVLPVIFFHAGFSLFGGGFIGVDLFFVISGYLITLIICEDIRNGTFNLLSFYERRAKRLLPALFFVVLMTIPFAWIVMFPNQFESFCKSLISVIFFGSNIFFWKESGYFSETAETIPFLHTWSLAVEEQFYLLMPLVLILIARFDKRKIFLTLVILVAMSFLLSEWGWRNKPTANFYLAPTRAWELLFGSLTALIVHNNSVKPSNVKSLIGFLMIVFSFLLFDKTIPVPSFYLLAPIMGVVLILLHADESTCVGKILGTNILVGIGLISYSTYLWHQPVFALSRISLSEQENPYLIYYLIIFTLILAFLTWKYVETPFRKKLQLPTKKFVTLLSSIAVVLLTLAIGGVLRQGDFGGWKQEILNFEKLRAESAWVWEKKNKIRRMPFDPNKTKILVVGDSNSGDLINILDTNTTENKFSLSSLTISSGCGNLYINQHKYQHFRSADSLEACLNADSLFSPSSALLLENADIVIFASNWQRWEINFLDESHKKLISNYGDKFWWFGSKRILFPELNILYKNGVLNVSNNYEKSPLTAQINMEMEVILDGRFIDPYKLFCVNLDCNIRDKKENFLFFDDFHLTPNGANFFNIKFFRLFTHIFESVEQTHLTIPF